MTDFFEAPPPRPKAPPTEPRVPAWFQPPKGELPYSVPLGEMIARNEQAAVGVTGGLAYTTGFELRFYAFTPEPVPDLEPFDRQALEDGEPAPAFLRVGLEYSDGSKLMNTTPRRLPDEDDGDGHDARPTMTMLRGTGWYREWHHDFWCWPLPPSGPLQLICEWPEMEIGLSRREIDAKSILDAAAQARRVSHALNGR